MQDDKSANSSASITPSETDQTPHDYQRQQQQQQRQPQQHPDDDANNKKRSRIPTSCSVCRKRKVKCDKKKPTCTACVKSELKHLCQYEEPKWVSETKRSQINKSLELVDVLNQEDLPLDVKKAFQELVNKVHQLESESERRFPFVDENLADQQLSRNLAKPYILDNANLEFDQNDKVDVFDYLPVLVKKGRLEHNGPFTAASFMRQDRYSKVIWLSVWKRLEAKNTRTHGSFAKDPFANEVINNNNSKFLAGFVELRKQKLKNKQSSIELRESTKSLPERIIDVLPDKGAIMRLIFRFFKVLYPYFPLINENVFFVDLNKIIELPFNISKVEKLTLDHDKESLALLGIVLIILRLSYVSLTPDDFEDTRFSQLKNTPIEAPVIQLAKECLSQYQFLRKSYGLRVLQLMLFLNLYYRYAPEDDYVSDQSGGHISLGLLFSMGYSVGVHRNPYIFMNLNETGDRKKEVAQGCRKLWHKLIEMDCNQSVFSGEPLHCVDNRSYDIPLPIRDDLDDAVDSWVVKDYKLLEERNQLFRKFSQTLLNLHNSPSVMDILRLIQMLENFSEYKIGSPTEILQEDLPSYGKVKRISYFVEIQLLLLNLNNQLVTHFENQDNPKQVYIYLVQALQHCRSIHDTLINVLFNENKYFGPNERGHHTQEFSFFIKPLACMALTKTLITLANLNTRIIHSKQVLEQTSNRNGNTKLEEKLELTEELVKKIYAMMESVSGIMTRLSVGNYNLTRNLIAVKLFMKELRDFNFINPTVYKSSDSSSGQPEVEPESNPLFKHFYDFKNDLIPKENYTMLLITPELSYLVGALTIDVLKVLKPLFTAPEPAPEARQSGVYFDPVNGQTRPLNHGVPTEVTGSGFPVLPRTQTDITQSDLNNFFFANLPAAGAAGADPSSGTFTTGFNTSTAHPLQWQGVPQNLPGQNAQQFAMSQGNNIIPDFSMDGFQYIDQILSSDDYALLFGDLNSQNI
ncbi:hypothetical protein WICPIJ_000211 [Wickerhamomyces pijperi]|uniref:Zn(2)-C6 fungal-type domain-containing protein n=1 Tax=Wickerhamomyces pijperi TaxID=599730 RepID=A0A9P8QHE0_WICPI|nr:hypothetical protein WICPIJ_000211 [Wickerhamomyces pijperi]